MLARDDSPRRGPDEREPCDNPFEILAGIDLTQVLIQLVVLIASLSVHEAAHAWAADRLGDPTARQLGRLSLNPAVHVDPIGTLVFPLIAMLTNVPLIGWAKPVPVDTRHLQAPEARLRADRRGRSGEQPRDGRDRRGRVRDAARHARPATSPAAR